MLRRSGDRGTSQHKSLRQEKPQLVLRTAGTPVCRQCTGHGEQGRDDARKSTSGPNCVGIMQDKRVLDFYCECDRKTPGRF